MRLRAMAWVFTGVVVAAGCATDSGPVAIRAEANTTTTSSTSTTVPKTTTTESTAPPIAVRPTTFETIAPIEGAVELTEPFTSPDGVWTAVFITRPRPITQDAGGATVTLYTEQRGNDLFAVGAAPAPFGIAEDDLAVAVQGSVDNVGAALASESPTTVSGHAARAFVADLQGPLSARVYGVVIDAGDQLLEVIVIDADNDNSAEALTFVASVTLTA